LREEQQAPPGPPVRLSQHPAKTQILLGFVCPQGASGGFDGGRDQGRNIRVAADESSSWGIGCPFRVYRIDVVSRVFGFRDPALPLALAPAVRFSIVESGRLQLSERRQTLVGLTPPYGVLPSNFQSVRRSGQTPLMDFRSLQHVQISAIALLCREFPILPTHPPSGFDCPLDGFIPPKPGRFYFTPAALLGFTLRSLLLPLRYPVRFRPSGPTCQFFVRFTTLRGAARPARTTVASGLRPVQESLAANVLLARQPPAAPLGFSPSKACGRRNPSSVPRRPLTCLTNSAKPNRVAPQSLTYRRLAWSRAIHEAWLDQAAFLGFPHLCDPRHLRIGFAGLCVHLTPGRLLPFDRGALKRIPIPS
jgi:hypothetical protein